MPDFCFLFSDPCFALYRMPDTTEVHAVCAQKAEELQTETELLDTDEASPRWHEGFVAAPFDARKCPKLFIPAEKRARFFVEELPCKPQVTSGFEESDRDRYMQDFAAVKQILKEERCTKLVLARRVKVRIEGGMPDILSLFGAACMAYPHNYIALWHTPQSGTWLTATPELLLSRTDNNCCHTMALAGTMSAVAPDAKNLSGWSAKNKKEQDLVQQHLVRVLEKAGVTFRASRLKIVPSGDLLHLRTDFEFSVPKSPALLLRQLHPTPAVCGMPTAYAWKSLATVEHICRDYYAGYSGPVNKDGTFAFYVTLRCLHTVEQGYDLFAGGGVLPQSRCEEEWLETERKLDAVRLLLPLAD